MVLVDISVMCWLHIVQAFQYTTGLQHWRYSFDLSYVLPFHPVGAESISARDLAIHFI